jgi:hypothetical protein
MKPAAGSGIPMSGEKIFSTLLDSTGGVLHEVIVRDEPDLI